MSINFIDRLGDSEDLDSAAAFYLHFSFFVSSTLAEGAEDEKDESKCQVHEADGKDCPRSFLSLLAEQRRHTQCDYEAEEVRDDINQSTTQRIAYSILRSLLYSELECDEDHRE